MGLPLSWTRTASVRRRIRTLQVSRANLALTSASAWADGHPDVLRASELIRFCPGHTWSEAAAGTNAVGTALAADHAIQVFSAEHYRSEVHGWQCSAAPVHDPDSGRILGAIDVTGSYRTAHPSNLALVQMAARLVEERLRGEMLTRDNRILGLFAEHTARHRGPAAAVSHTGRIWAATPIDWTSGRIELSIEQQLARLSDGASVAVQPLGEGALLRPTAAAAPRRRRIPSHHLTLLGCSRALLRGPAGSRLATRPYRLEGVEIDLELVKHLLAGGHDDQARELCRGPLLESSSVAEIVAARRDLERRLGAAPSAA